MSQLLASVGQGVRASASASAHKHLLSAYYVQHIKKQRHYFVNKRPSSQGYIMYGCESWTVKKAER